MFSLLLKNLASFQSPLTCMTVNGFYVCPGLSNLNEKHMGNSMIRDKKKD